MKINKLLAKPISYGDKRSHDDVLYCVIHYTGNKNDTAYANARYFAETNTRKAGAHFFIDKAGNVYKSINMNRIAWSVGGFFTSKGGAAKLKNICKNSNSVSIELCDCVDKPVSKEQKEALKLLVVYIKKHCHNLKQITRHWDVNGKNCPSYYVKHPLKWKKLRKELMKLL